MIASSPASDVRGTALCMIARKMHRSSAQQSSSGQNVLSVSASSILIVVGRVKSDNEAGGALTRSSTAPVVIDAEDHELTAGSLVIDLTRPEYKGPAPKITEISDPKDGSLIVTLGAQNAATGEWLSKLLALQESDGRFRANLKLLGHQRADGSSKTVT